MVYQQLYPQVLRFLQGMLPRNADTADLAQEVFLRLHRRWPDEGSTAGQEGAVRFWVFRVAKNIAINELNRRGVRERLQFWIRPRDPQPDPHESYERQESAMRIRAGLERLPPHQKAVLLLREWENLTYDEIAQSLGVSVAKVKSDLFRARQRLREEVQRQVSREESI